MSPVHAMAPSGLGVERWTPEGRLHGGVVVVAGRPEDVPRARVERLAGQGFVVVVPDLAWRGPWAGDPAEQLADHEVIADLSAARDLLPAGLPRFVLGIGAGGLYARFAACAVMGLAGVVAMGGRIWYSGVSARRPIQPLDLLPGLSCALQCHFDEDDPEAPPPQVDELERRLLAGTRPWHMFRYPAGGGAVGASGWHGAEADAAWGRAANFLLHVCAETP